MHRLAEARVSNQQTGARWQRDWVARHGADWVGARQPGPLLRLAPDTQLRYIVVQTMGSIKPMINK